ncbi:MAG: hypothetical protein AABY86_12530, partial [Bdellovibrionota bacterium]
KIGSTRLWSWKEAMTKSCNGFFLDEKIESWTDFNQLFKMLKIDSTISSMAQAIGLTPGINLSLSHALQLYSWLTLTEPSIIDALLETSMSGTLEALPNSSWFFQQKISLKTGTQRDIKSRPEHSWIVAVGPRLENNRPSFLAAIHAEGASTHYLLYELYQRLKNISRNNYFAKIQLLNLVPHNKISLRCGQDRPLMVKHDQHWLWASSSSIDEGDFRSGRQYLCLGGPLELSFPMKDKKREHRKYYGVLEFQEKDKMRAAVENSELPLREKQAKARSQSPFKLITSERYYLWGVLAAEYPRGHKELLKSLALVAKNNLRYYQSENKNICDNTWCQVFGPGQELSAALSAKIFQVIEEMHDKNLYFANGKRWLYFSLGGLRPWHKVLSGKELERELGLDAIYRVSLSDDKISIVLKSNLETNIEKRVGCEVFRNQLRLLSCPEKISKKIFAKEINWHFEGRGEGHGQGLDLTKANTLSAQGNTAQEILLNYYPDVQIEKVSDLAQ